MGTEIELPPESSGSEVTQAQQANDDRADPQSPNTAGLSLDQDGQVTVAVAAPSNADAASTTSSDAGTDAETRTTANTQSVPGTSAQPGPAVPNGSSRPGSTDDSAGSSTAGRIGSGTTATGVTGPTQTGVGKASDDAANLNPITSEIQRLFGSTQEIVTPEPNILDKCATYTYNISIYLMTPQQYTNLITTKKKSVANLSLLMASGGASTSEPGATVTRETEDTNTVTITGVRTLRNQFFPLDFYLDNTQIRSIVNGKGTMSAHNVVELQFKIFEPNGITLIHNLASATDALGLGTGDNINAYLGQIYLMVIRFYGWDQNGNLIVSQDEKTANQSDKTAIVEKFIPFVFTNIKFRVAGKVTEYDCTAICPQNMIASGQQRGVIPYNIQLTGGSLSDVLGTQLPNALNSYQKELVKKQIFTYEDEYSVVLLPPLNSPGIDIIPPGNVNLRSTGMPKPATANQQLNPQAQSVDKNKKGVSATAGQSIVQFIDQTTRTSDYIYKQQRQYIDPKTGKTVLNPGVAKLMAWYRIGFEATPIPGKWDPKRGDFAYKIKYQVSPYLVTDVLSDYFPRSPRWTAPKEYYYWFTGQNTQIITFEQEFNSLYYLIVNSRQEARSQSILKNQVKKGYQPNSDQSIQGMEGQVNEPGANAASYLYSPADLARVKFTILGDPSWIQQGEVWSGIAGNNFNANPFLPDGTVNYESREILFDIIYNTPADYNFNTGLLAAERGTGRAQQLIGRPRVLEQRFRYKAVYVTHNFSSGKFTQDLEGVLVLPDDSEVTNLNVGGGGATSSTNAQNQTGPDQTDAEIAQRTAAVLSGDTANQSTGSRESTAAVNSQNAEGTVAPATVDTYSASGAGIVNPSGTEPVIGVAQSSPPTSSGLIVGPTGILSSTNYATGGVAIQPVEIFVPYTNAQGLPTGEGAFVTNQIELQTLASEGLITQASYLAANARLENLIDAQQQPVTDAPPQLIDRDP